MNNNDFSQCHYWCNKNNRKKKKNHAGKYLHDLIVVDPSLTSITWNSHFLYDFSFSHHCGGILPPSSLQHCFSSVLDRWHNHCKVARSCGCKLSPNHLPFIAPLDSMRCFWHAVLTNMMLRPQLSALCPGNPSKQTILFQSPSNFAVMDLNIQHAQWRL